jgi:hypothetical protein
MARPASVRQIEIRQPRAFIRGLERSVLTFRRLPQTPLRLYVHDSEILGAWAADDPTDESLTYIQVTCVAPTRLAFSVEPNWTTKRGVWECCSSMGSSRDRRVVYGNERWRKIIWFDQLNRTVTAL